MNALTPQPLRKPCVMNTVDLTEEIHQQREHPTTCRRHQKPSWRNDARCVLCLAEDS